MTSKIVPNSKRKSFDDENVSKKRYKLLRVQQNNQQTTLHVSSGTLAPNYGGYKGSKNISKE